MDRRRFWELIDEARAAGADATARAAALERGLGALPAGEIESFARMQAELMSAAYAWPLWGAAHVIGGGCSDDGFEYFRGWLLLQGREVWESALADPDSLAQAVPEGETAECEEVMYAAPRAFERVAGAGLGLAMGGSTGEPAGSSWDEDDLPALFPRLWERFGVGGPAELPDMGWDEEKAQRTMGEGLILLEEGQYRLARNFFGQVARHAPRRLTALLATNNAAWALLLLDTADARREALPLAQEAWAGLSALGEPGSAKFLDAARGTLGLALIENGLDPEGVSLVEEALTGHQPSPATEALRRCTLAIGLAHLGDPVRASGAVEAARAADPDCVLLARAAKAVAAAR